MIRSLHRGKVLVTSGQLSSRSSPLSPWPSTTEIERFQSEDTRVVKAGGRCESVMECWSIFLDLPRQGRGGSLVARLVNKQETKTNLAPERLELVGRSLH